MGTNNSKPLQRVKLLMDNEGNSYIIPNKLSEEFVNDLDNDMIVFPDKYGEYMEGLKNVQLYAREIE
jgi:hypothetical protein